MNFPISIIDAKSTPTSSSLYPITSYETGRYEKAHIVELKDTIVEAGMFASTHHSLPSYLPPQWAAYVHPEGDTYFYRNAVLPVVTDAYIYHSDLAFKVSKWVAFIEQELATRQLVFAGNVELYVKIDKDSCYYYFVDHDSQTIFWMEDYDSNNLYLPQVVSPSHLKTVLKERYWNHVQNFSEHLGGLPLKSLDDLICVLNYAIADHMTSTASTFPYDEDTCRKFVKLLKNSRDHINDGHATALIARIWCLIENNRYWLLHGQENAKLSRMQAVLLEEPLDIKWSQRLTALLSCNVSQRYATRLNELYIDRYVYQRQWSTFITSCFKDWRNSSVAATSTLLLHMLLILVPFSRTLAVASAGFSSISLFSSIFLMHFHEELQEGSATDAHDYLTTIYSEKYKFQWTAFTYSVPKAFYLWGISAFFLQWLTIANFFCGTFATAGMIALLALVVLSLRFSISGFNCAVASKIFEGAHFFRSRQHDLEKAALPV